VSDPIVSAMYIVPCVASSRVIPVLLATTLRTFCALSLARLTGDGPPGASGFAYRKVVPVPSTVQPDAGKSSDALSALSPLT